MFDYRGFRFEVGLSQMDMASLLSCNQSYISKLQSSKQDLSDENRAKLVSKFGEDIVSKYESSRTKLYRQAPVASEITSLPLVHIDSVGGIDSHNAILEPEYVEKYIPFVDAKTNDFCIYQSGDSMAPTIPSGAILHLREVVDWQEYFGYGDYYVLLLADDRRITKQVVRSETDSSKYVFCKSINPDHSDEELPRSFIKRVFKIIHVLTNNGW
jgi:hypothetical protein